MNIAKSLFRGLCASLFKLSVALFLVITPVVLVFGTPDKLKSSLKDSKVYDSAVGGLIEGINKETEGQADNPFKDPSVQQAAKTALSPAFLETSTNSIIDGIYGWLSGKTPQPTFTIDATGVKEQFTKAAGDYAVNRAKSLPTCTVQQLRQMNTNIDPLSAECVPPGYNIESLRDLVAQQLNQPSENGEPNILQQPTITADTLPKNEEGKTPVQEFTEGAKNAPEIYGWLIKAPQILAGLAILSGGLVVWLYDDKRRAVRNLALTLLPVGIFGLLGVYLTRAVFSKLEGSAAVTKADASLQEPLINLVQALSSAVNQKLLLIAGLYVLVSAGTLLALHFTKPKVLVADGPALPDTPEPQPDPVDKPNETTTL